MKNMRFVLAFIFFFCTPWHIDAAVVGKSFQQFLEKQLAQKENMLEALKKELITTIINASNDKQIIAIHKGEKEFEYSECSYTIENLAYRLLEPFEKKQVLELIVQPKPKKSSALHCLTADEVIVYTFIYNLEDKKSSLKKQISSLQLENLITNQLSENAQITFQEKTYGVHAIERKIIRTRNNIETYQLLYTMSEKNNPKEFALKQIISINYGNRTRTITDTSFMPKIIFEALPERGKISQYEEENYQIGDEIKIQKLQSDQNREVWLLTTELWSTGFSPAPILANDAYFAFSNGEITIKDLTYPVQQKTPNRRNLKIGQGYIYKDRLYRVKTIELKKDAGEATTIYTLVFDSSLFGDKAPEKKKLLIIDKVTKDPQGRLFINTREIELSA